MKSWTDFLPAVHPVRVLFIIILFLTHETVSQNLIIQRSISCESISKRFPPLNGFKRISVEPESFASWLRELPLRPPGSPVMDFRGRIFKSPDDTTVAAVISMDVSGKNLWQCMDMIVGMHAEYLLEKGKSGKLSGLLPEGTMITWFQWTQGYRPQISGSRFLLQKIGKADSSFSNLNKYLNLVFELTGTQAYYHFYPAIHPEELQAGDFVVKKGYDRAHVVLIVDLAVNENGKMMAMIGQGDTPACQFYLLNYRKGNPWFPVDSRVDKLPLPIKKEMFWSGLRRFPD